MHPPIHPLATDRYIIRGLRALYPLYTTYTRHGAHGMPDRCAVVLVGAWWRSALRPPARRGRADARGTTAPQAQVAGGQDTPWIHPPRRMAGTAFNTTITRERVMMSRFTDRQPPQGTRVFLAVSSDSSHLNIIF